MWNRLRRWWRSDLAVDLGTANTVVAREGTGVLLREPSVVAVREQAGSRADRSGRASVLGRGTAVGKLARQMIGRTPGSIRAERPIRHGVVADFELCRVMLEFFYRKIAVSGLHRRPRVIVTVPGELTPVERQAVLLTAERAGSSRVWLLDQAHAAGIGAGLPLAEPTANLIIDLGAGTTEIALFSMGEPIAARSLRIAGETLDAAIIKHLRREFSLTIGPRTAEDVKIAIGSADPLARELTLEVGGRDSISGIARKATVTSEEIREAIRIPLEEIVAGLREVMEAAPEELLADLSQAGLVLSGGGSLLRGMDRFLRERFDLPVRIADDPLNCVARGAVICLDHLSLWRTALERPVTAHRTGRLRTRSGRAA